jgi:hypothetical protein
MMAMGKIELHCVQRNNWTPYLPNVANLSLNH